VGEGDVLVGVGVGVAVVRFGVVALLLGVTRVDVDGDVESV
jgi:hypothetical protein